MPRASILPFAQHTAIVADRRRQQIGQHAAPVRRVDAAVRLAADLQSDAAALKRNLIQELIERIEVGADVIVVAIRRQSLLQRLDVASDTSEGEIEPLVIREPAQLRRRGIEAKLVLYDRSDRERNFDQSLCRLIANARFWFEALANGRVGSVRELAARDGVAESEPTRVLPRAFMAPDAVEAILDGRQPVELTATSLRRMEQLPSGWNAQRDAF